MWTALLLFADVALGNAAVARGGAGVATAVVHTPFANAAFAGVPWSEFVGSVHRQSGRACAEDAPLRAAALALLAEASATAPAGTAPATPSGRKLRGILQRAGSTAVWPRMIFVQDTSLAQVEHRAHVFVGPTASHDALCTVVTERLRDNSYRAVALVANVRGRVDPVPRTYPLGARARFQYLPPAADGFVAVTVRTPRGQFVHPVLALTAGNGGRHLEWEVVLGLPGEYTVQLMWDAGHGPKPAGIMSIFADWAPHPTLDAQPTPVQHAATLEAVADATALSTALMQLRHAYGLAPLQRMPSLDRLANEQLVRNVEAREVAHDTGAGALPKRALALGARAAAWGENIGRAPTIRDAWEGLLDSPSHAENMLSAAFDSYGLASTTDADGMTWIVQTFAKQLSGTPSSTASASTTGGR
jgi:hypothetical protein